MNTTINNIEKTVINDYVIKSIEQKELPFDESTEAMERDYLKVIVELKPYNIEALHSNHTKLYKEVLEMNLIEILSADVKKLPFIKNTLNNNMRYLLKSEDTDVLNTVKDFVDKQIKEQFLPVIVDVDDTEFFTVEDLLKIRRNEDSKVSSYEKLLGMDFFEMADTVKRWKHNEEMRKAKILFNEENDINSIVF